MAGDVWSKSDDDYNSGSTVGVGDKKGTPMRVSRSSKGYTYSDTPTSRSLGFAGKAARPRDGAYSRLKDDADNDRKTAETVLAKYEKAKESKKKSAQRKRMAGKQASK